MRIYLAAVYTNDCCGVSKPGSGRIRAKVTHDLEYPWVLESYHYLRDSGSVPLLKAIRTEKKTIFLDSGAFTMFTQGAKVDLGQYTQFIKANKDIIHTASNVDHIGRGGEAISYNNQKLLQKMGANVQPVHHARDTDDWLQKYMAEGYDYIFLGGMVPETTQYLRGWLDHIWGRYLAGKDGSAKIKVHGFGLTTLQLMTRYPWYSVDSTSWLRTGSFGSIFLDLPHGDTKMFMSEKSPRRKDWDQHYDSLSPVARKVVDDRVRELGYDPAKLRTEYAWRDHFNISFFKRMLARPDYKFNRQHQPTQLFA